MTGSIFVFGYFSKSRICTRRKKTYFKMSKLILNSGCVTFTFRRHLFSGCFFFERGIKVWGEWTSINLWLVFLRFLIVAITYCFYFERKRTNECFPTRRCSSWFVGSRNKVSIVVKDFCCLFWIIIVIYIYTGCLKIQEDNKLICNHYQKN